MAGSMGLDNWTLYCSLAALGPKDAIVFDTSMLIGAMVDRRDQVFGTAFLDA